MTRIALPALVEGASMTLNDSHNPDDVGFATQIKGNKEKTKPPVDAVCVDHTMIVNKKNIPALRCLFVIVKGEDINGNSLVGKNAVADLNFAGDAADYTYHNLRMLGFDFTDVDAAVNGSAEQQAKAEIAFQERLNDSSKSGVGSKLVTLKFEEDNFKGTVYRRLALGGIGVPMAKLDTAQTKTMLGTGMFAKLAASKVAPKRDTGVNGSAGTPSNRNPTSPPPARTGGAAVADTDEIPF
ncbi:MAG: hypothetical protein E6Q97_06855 [Desulfurellales bacterium]|nr:MAG: hypothetical protein E6Q97_06855 [Desulfurellales bacterium]